MNSYQLDDKMGKPRWVNKLFRETSWLVQKNNLTNHGHISKMPGWDHIMCPSFSSLSRGSAAAAVPWALKNPTKCTQRSPTTRAIPFGRVWIPMIHEGWLIFIAGWWFGTMEFYDFPFSWEEYIIPTDEVIFFTGVGWNHQPDYHIWSLSYRG